MTSIQEIHHSPVEGEEFHIQDGSSWEAPKRKPRVCKHKPHKKNSKCSEREHKWEHEHKREHEHKWFDHDEESDSDSHCTTDSDSCLDFSHDSSSGCKTPRQKNPICKHKSKRCFEFDECFECKDKHKDFFDSTSEFHNCDHSAKECLHFKGKGHNSFDCEHTFKKGLACSHRFRHTTFECIGHSRLCLFELIRRWNFFSCHRPKPWPKAHKKHI